MVELFSLVTIYNQYKTIYNTHLYKCSSCPLLFPLKLMASLSVRIGNKETWKLCIYILLFESSYV